MVPVEEMSIETWRRMNSVNLDGVFYMCKAFIPELKQSPSGRIINIGSSMCWSIMPAVAHYYATKMAIVGLTRGLANELGKFGVTANTVAPGLIQTEGTSETVPQFFDLAPQTQSIKRLGQPDDVAGLISFLASEDSKFVTGQTLMCNGGQTKH
jgi:NAD(P)-dependent dehydrogenase (short-subunit alcohol dehydrogenase family)